MGLYDLSRILQAGEVGLARIKRARAFERSAGGEVSRPSTFESIGVGGQVSSAPRRDAHSR